MCDMDADIKGLGDIPDILLLPLQKKLKENAWFNQSEQKEKPNNFKVFSGNTDHVVFQFPIDRSHHYPSRYFPIWDKWRSIILPVIEYSTQTYGYQNGCTSRIMLASLLAGQKSLMHVDHTPSADLPHKIHIPLQTHPDIEFRIEDRIYHLPVGQASEVNNKRLHGTVNPTNIDRIHLVFDYFSA